MVYRVTMRSDRLYKSLKYIELIYPRALSILQPPRAAFRYLTVPLSQPLKSKDFLPSDAGDVLFQRSDRVFPDPFGSASLKDLERLESRSKRSCIN